MESSRASLRLRMLSLLRRDPRESLRPDGVAREDGEDGVRLDLRLALGGLSPSIPFLQIGHVLCSLSHAEAHVSWNQWEHGSITTSSPI
jgi:hypothetical protein